MKQKIVLCWLVWLTCAGSPNAQQVKQGTKEKFVVVPSELVLMTVASQPESSIEFKEVRFLVSLDGGGTRSFIVSNKGAKPIRAFTIGGVDWTKTWSEDYTKRLLMPGETAFKGDDNIEIVPLTSELRKKLKLNGPMKAILTVMVIEIQYADGTTYDARSTYEALKEHSERLMELEDRVETEKRAKPRQ
jgi:hypothetical protein